MYSMHLCKVYVRALTQVLFWVKFHDYLSEIMKLWVYEKLYSFQVRVR
jgi:hypothetical protein